MTKVLSHSRMLCLHHFLEECSHSISLFELRGLRVVIFSCALSSLSNSVLFSYKNAAEYRSGIGINSLDYIFTIFVFNFVSNFRYYFYCYCCWSHDLNQGQYTHHLTQSSQILTDTYTCYGCRYNRKVFKPCTVKNSFSSGNSIGSECSTIESIPNKLKANFPVSSFRLKKRFTIHRLLGNMAKCLMSRNRKPFLCHGTLHLFQDSLRILVATFVILVYFAFHFCYVKKGSLYSRFRRRRH